MLHLFVIKALQQAFNLTQTQKSSRRAVIVLIAAAYNEYGFQDAYQTANVIKDNGIAIIVINYVSTNGVLTTSLQNISSPGYYYNSNLDGLYDSRISYALTQLNCFCPPGNLQFQIYNTAWENFTNYGDCFYSFNGDTNPIQAERACRLESGVLAALNNQQKLDFITDYLLPYSLKGKKKFTVGFHKSANLNNTWNWWDYDGSEYSLGDFPLLSDIPTPEDNYGYMWNHYGFKWILTTGNSVSLPYICQIKACDASFICDQDNFKKFEKHHL
uniref:C-type lectin domain-containing protein n=1 Tax=Panagrolaimus sp. ES5 TaxID=591445 RepID=A0AC34FXF5_9BILA